MKSFKFTLTMLFALLAGESLVSAQSYGDVSPGAVPAAISYQGRLEKDGAPVTGNVGMNIRIYNSDSGGTCLWGPKISGTCSCSDCTGNAGFQVSVYKGAFDITLNIPYSVLSGAGNKYLELEAGGVVLSPRDPLRGGLYSYVTKRLAPGTNLQFNSMITAYDVYLSTRSGYVGIGTSSPSSDLDIVGDVNMIGTLYFNGKKFNQYSQPSISEVNTAESAYVRSDTAVVNSGDIIMHTSQEERLRILSGAGGSRANIKLLGDLYNYSGIMGVKPLTALVVWPSDLSYGASSYFRIAPRDTFERESTAEFYSYSDASVGLSSTDPLSYTRGVLDMSSSGFRIGSEYGGSGALRPIWFTSGPNLLASISPAGLMYFASYLYTPSYLRAGDIAFGRYTWGSTALANEISTLSGVNLLLQYRNSSGKVGIGTVAPSEKLHVAGSVRATGTVSASTGTFSGDVAVTGAVSANNPYMGGNTVQLSSTTVYGNVVIHGGLTVDDLGDNKSLAYKQSTQTFTGADTFSEVHINAGKGLVSGYNAYPSWLSSRYVNVLGANPNDNARVYLVAGDELGNVSAADSAGLYFYRGNTESAKMVSSNGLFTITANSALTMKFSDAGAIDLTLGTAKYAAMRGGFKLFSGASSSVPALYVGAGNGAVGIGTDAVTYSGDHPNPVLTVAGHIRFPQTTGGIVFGDGTFLSQWPPPGGMGVNSVSSSGDALISAGSGGTGRIFLVAQNVTGLTVLDGGASAMVGIGISTPTQALHISSGNVRLGSDYSPTLSVSSSVVVSGGLYQNKDVYLALNSGSRVGIGITSPATTLDIESNLYIGGILRLSTGGEMSLNTLGAYGRITSSYAGDAIVFTANGAGISFTGSGSHPFTSAGNDLRLSAPALGINKDPAYQLDVSGDMFVRSNAVVSGTMTVQGTSFSVNGTAFQLSGGLLGLGGITAVNSLDVLGDIRFGNAGTKSILGADGSMTLYTPLATAYGGIGRNTFASLGVLYGNGSNAVSITNAPSDGNLLVFSGGHPVFASVNIGIDDWVGNQLFLVANGSTGNSSYSVVKGIMLGNGSSALGQTAAGSSGQVLTSNGSGAAPGYAVVSLADTNSVTGVLSAANGGTGSASLTSNKFLSYNGTAITATAYSAANFMPTISSINPSDACSTGALGYSGSTLCLCFNYGLKTWVCY